MKIGRTIVIELNIEGPRWQADANEELRHALNHIDSSFHMWDTEGWQDKLLLGTDRRPTGLMRLHHGYVIGALPEDDDPPPPAARAAGSAPKEPVRSHSDDRLGRRRKAALVPPTKPTPKPTSSVRMVTPDTVAALPKGVPSRSITRSLVDQSVRDQRSLDKLPKPKRSKAAARAEDSIRQGRLPLPKPKRRKAQ